MAGSPSVTSDVEEDDDQINGARGGRCLVIPRVMAQQRWRLGMGVET